MEVSVLNINGQETGRKVTLNESIFGDRVTTQNLKVLKVIPEHNILLVKGSVAGCNGSTLLIEK